MSPEQKNGSSDFCFELSAISSTQADCHEVVRDIASAGGPPWDVFAEEPAAISRIVLNRRKQKTTPGPSAHAMKRRKGRSIAGHFRPRCRKNTAGEAIARRRGRHHPFRKSTRAFGTIVDASAFYAGGRSRLNRDREGIEGDGVAPKRDVPRGTTPNFAEPPPVSRFRTPDAGIPPATRMS